MRKIMIMMAMGLGTSALKADPISRETWEGTKKSSSRETPSSRDILLNRGIKKMDTMMLHNVMKLSKLIPEGYARDPFPSSKENNGRVNGKTISAGTVKKLYDLCAKEFPVRKKEASLNKEAYEIFQEDIKQSKAAYNFYTNLESVTKSAAENSKTVATNILSCFERELIQDGINHTNSTDLSHMISKEKDVGFKKELEKALYNRHNKSSVKKDKIVSVISEDK